MTRQSSNALKGEDLEERLEMAAPEARRVLRQLLKSTDDRVRLRAAHLLLDLLEKQKGEPTPVTLDPVVLAVVNYWADKSAEDAAGEPSITEFLRDVEEAK